MNEAERLQLLEELKGAAARVARTRVALDAARDRALYKPAAAERDQRQDETE